MLLSNLFGALVNISAGIAAQKPYDATGEQISARAKKSQIVVVVKSLRLEELTYLFAIGCGIDSETGLPSGWKSTEISLDVVIILDTSEAMGEVAVTDVTLQFYTAFHGNF